MSRKLKPSVAPIRLKHLQALYQVKFFYRHLNVKINRKRQISIISSEIKNILKIISCIENANIII